jgi:AcrR family transcriptional regulator
MTKRDAKRQAILDTAYRLFSTQGFDGTSVSQITAEVGGSKATIYSHFPSKEELFVECMTAAVDDYITAISEHGATQLETSGVAPEALLREYGISYLKLVCSSDVVATRRLMIAEAARAGIGKLFLAKIAAMRTQVVAFLSRLMTIGALRPDDAGLAAEHLRALLEAELIEPLLLDARDTPPADSEIAFAVERAVSAFLRAYAPVSP